MLLPPDPPAACARMLTIFEREVDTRGLVSSDEWSPKHGSCNLSLSSAQLQARDFLVLHMRLLHVPAAIGVPTHAMLLRMHVGTASACARFSCLLIKTLTT